ncbi:MAG: asparaginase [Flavobacteriaceae bacterium]|nr:asparaginase [Flavobacteriaceae bacterium]
MKPQILLIYTGGTIGMIKDPITATLQAFDFAYLIEKIPELNLLDCDIHPVSFETPLDSSNMNPSHWIAIATIIEENYQTHDGFVVLHGSDTMSYTASALSFMLENLAKPVILTGSQLPIGDLRTDAKENLITSIQIAALQNNNTAVIKEVGLYFEYKLYRGNRTTKINAEHFQAFASLNFPALVTSGVHLKVNHEILHKNYSQARLVVHKKMNTNIVLLKLFPGISPVILQSILEIPTLKAVVIETYGSGNATTEDWFLEAIEEALDKGVFVINVTQCAGGSVSMNQYQTGKTLQKLGVISGKDTTTESAMTKLMFMLGLETPKNMFKTDLKTSIRGEIS